MGKTVVVIGAQWGDEGKGKFTNFLATQADVVVRYQGGNNAGHTIAFNNHTYFLHLLPSGVFYPEIINILGNGMVINPIALLDEIKYIKALGFTCSNIAISDRSHVVFDYHVIIDQLQETHRGTMQIGTTKKGIGPTYVDKIARQGIRMGDFISLDFKELFYRMAESKNREIIHLGGDALDIDVTYLKYQEIADQLKGYVKDTVVLLNEAFNQNKKILFEGAQGSLLDIDFGTYPYVTSSNPSSGGVVIGSGLGVTKIQEVLGIVKAYTTRVGEGPFPTEIKSELGDIIRKRGREYGTTTQRPRRIGWFDGVIVRYSAMINGMTGIALTLLDVLSDIDELRICYGYVLDGKLIHHIPARIEDFNRCIPQYIVLEGWKENITMATCFDDLPINTKKYLETIEEVVGVAISYISVGPDKTQTIVKNEIFR